jgi:hypothetical protein
VRSRVGDGVGVGDALPCWSGYTTSIRLSRMSVPKPMPNQEVAGVEM